MFRTIRFGIEAVAARRLSVSVGDKARAAISSQEEIQQQQNLLTIHRRNLALYLKQQAQLGGAFILPGIANGIYEARESIRHIKQILRDWGTPVADHPDDEPAIS